MKLDEDKLFKYSSLQGEFVKELGLKEGIESIVLYEYEKVYYKSTAILKILRSLGSVWVFTNIFYIIPTFIRDFITALTKHTNFNIRTISQIEGIVGRNYLGI